MAGAAGSVQEPLSAMAAYSDTSASARLHEPHQNRRGQPGKHQFVSGPSHATSWIPCTGTALASVPAMRCFVHAPQYMRVIKKQLFSRSNTRLLYYIHRDTQTRVHIYVHAFRVFLRRCRSMHERILNPYQHSMPVLNDMFSLFMDSTYKTTKSLSYAKRARNDRERTRSATTWTPTSAAEVSLQPHRAQTTRSVFHSSTAPAPTNKDKSKRNMNVDAAKGHLFPDIAPKSCCSVTQSPCQLPTLPLYPPPLPPPASPPPPTYPPPQISVLLSTLWIVQQEPLPTLPKQATPLLRPLVRTR